MKRLSFILALIIALSTMIGLFATPAYAEESITPDYVVDGTTYATVGAALTAAASNEKDTVYIRVDVDTTEVFNNAPIEKNIVVYSDNATAPTLSAAASVEKNTDSSLDGSNFGAIFDMKGGSLTLNNIDITISNGAVSAANYCAVFFNKNSGLGNLTINNCDINTVGRGIHINAGATVSSGVTINITNSTFTTLNSAIQHNARTANTNTTANITLTNVGISATNYGLYVQNKYANITLNNCYVLDGGSVKNFIYSTTKGVVHTVNMNNCDITTTGITVSYYNTAAGSVMNFINNSLRSPQNVVHVRCTGENQTIAGTFNLVNSDMECTSTNYIVSIDPASKSGANITATMNVYSGTYGTKGKGFLNNDADARINIYGGTFTSTNEENGFIMGANTKAYFYGGTITAPLPFHTNNAGQQATGITATTVGTTTTYLPENVVTDNNTIALAGAQLLNGTTAESASTSARFVATLTTADLSEYTEVGFYISKVNGSVASEGDYIVKKNTTSVFTSIQAGGAPYVAADGSYIVLAEITDIANADFGDTVYVRAYAKTASGTIVSDVQEFSVTKALAN